MDFRKDLNRRDVFKRAIGATLGLASLPKVPILTQVLASSSGNPGTVLPGFNSQVKNEVGIHWLRISCDYRYLRALRDYCTTLFGKPAGDGRGLFYYDSRTIWANKASLNYDLDRSRSGNLHKDRITLDVPGSALDQMGAKQIFQLINALKNRFDCRCSRIDVFWDDYDRIIEPKDLHKIAANFDYSGFHTAQPKPRYKSGRLTHDEVAFGTRGNNGGGKYLRVYDKNLESDGEYNCIRWEPEFNQDKADEVFSMLAETTANPETYDAYATLCSSIVGGVITFVKRGHEKNVDRMQRHEWWELLLSRMGSVKVRVAKQENTLEAVEQWIERTVAPSLACYASCCKSQGDFLNFLVRLLDDGEGRLSPNLTNILNEHRGTVTHRWNSLTAADDLCDLEEQTYVSTFGEA